jgi:membrane-bound lytic murein transglycosylase D
MEVYPIAPRLRILLITLPLLFWAGCVTDTGILKGPENRQPDTTVVGEAEGKPPPITPDQGPATQKKVEQPGTSPCLTEEQRAAQDAASPEKEDIPLTAHSPDRSKETNIAHLPQDEERKENDAARKGKGKGSQQQILSSPITSEKEAEELPSLIELEPGTIVPASADIEDELTLITNPQMDNQEDVPSGSLVENKPAEEAEPGLHKEQRSPYRAEDEGHMVSIPPEIEEPQEFVMLPQSDDEEPVRVPIWLEQGKPVPPFEDQDFVEPMERGNAARTLSSPPGSGKEKYIPGQVDRPMSLSGERKKHLEQEMLDSALEFCKASNDFWEQGDLYSAIDALDQAYSIILRVNPDEDSELLQQKEDLRFTISKRIIEVYSSRFTAANGRNSVIPLVMNSHVDRALDLFKGREKKFFLNSYRRSGKYRPDIVRALKEAGLPEELSWLPLIESGFKVKAFSRSRALGLWQFVASTGYKFGLKRDRWVDERMDPAKSTQAAISYLKELHRIFGDWTTALAAYNCGEGRVLRCIRDQKLNYLDNFWDLYERLPKETAFYVPKFLAVLHILKDPEAHGFTLPPVDGKIETKSVTIDKQAHLKTIASHTGVPYQLLKEINPSLRYSVTPDKPFSLKMPEGKGEVLLAKLEDIPEWRPSSVVHRVRRGESLSVIARRYGTSVSSIMRLNGLRSSHFIRAGWKLKIPTSRNLPISREASSKASQSRGSTDMVRYVVQKGDSLWRIAQRFGTTTKAIRSANHLSTTRLSIGQVLLVPQDLTAAEEIKTESYTVSKGDSPYLIATRHHMKLSQFLRINNLSPRSTIFPGQTLLVKAE